MAAPPVVPVLYSAFRTIAAARAQALPSLGFRVERGGPWPPFEAKRGGGGGRGKVAAEASGGTRALLQASLWGAEAAYVLWRLLPYVSVSGDPNLAISQISDLIGLSLNFFFVLPLLNSVGVHLLESPVLHPMAEGLFNFVLAWTLLFAPLLYTDYRRDRFKGSLDILWSSQMFLTNTSLIPYMAIRLNDPDADRSPPERSQLGSVVVNGAPVVGAVGVLVCVLSIAWAFFGRGDSDFGGTAERWQYMQSYVLSNPLANAFLWDIFLYSIFQPWLIGDNLRNVKADATEFVNVVRFVPVVGLVAYLLCLEEEK